MSRVLSLAGVVLAAAVVTGGCGGPSEDRVAAGAEPGGRPITHAMGSSTVPADPQRVVVLDTQELDATLSLGVVPVGAARTDVATELPSFLQHKKPAAEIATVGTIQDPDLEAIAALDPDLILSSKVRHEAVYPQLSAIAPTVFAERTGDAWKENFLLYADALGRRPAAEQQLADYAARARAIGDRAGAADETVSVVRFLPDEIRLYTPTSFIGTVLADVGFARPQVVQNAPGISVDISPEQIGLADADVIFTTTYGPADATGKAAAAALWGTLPAVRAGRAHEVSDDVWMLAIGPTGANLVLDDIERLTGG